MLVTEKSKASCTKDRHSTNSEISSGPRPSLFKHRFHFTASQWSPSLLFKDGPKIFRRIQDIPSVSLSEAGYSNSCRDLCSQNIYSLSSSVTGGDDFSVMAVSSA